MPVTRLLRRQLEAGINHRATRNLLCPCGMKSSRRIGSHGTFATAVDLHRRTSRVFSRPCPVRPVTLQRCSSTSSGLATGSHEPVDRRAGVDDNETPPSATCTDPKRRWRRFTPEEDQAIFKLCAEGYTLDAIGNRLPGRDPTSVKNRYHYRLRPRYIGGLLPSPERGQSPSKSGTDYTKEDDDRILQWQANPRGQKLSGVARELGRSVGSLTTHIFDFISRDVGIDSPALRPLAQKNTLGRQLRQPAAPLEAMTVVFLRNVMGTKWHDIAQQFPHRSVQSLRVSYHNTWLPRYKDIAVSDPRHWGATERATATSPVSPSRTGHDRRLATTPAVTRMQIGTGLGSVGVSVTRMSTWAHLQLAKHRNTADRSWEALGRRELHTSFTRFSGKPFTADEDRIILELRDANCKYSEIAVQIGRRPGAVWQRRARLLQMRNGSFTPRVTEAYTPGEDTIILSMKAAGHTAADIARTTGRSFYSVRCRLYNHLLPPLSDRETRNPARWSKAEDMRLVETKSAGLSWLEIKAAFPGRSIPSMSKHYYCLRRAVGPRSKKGTWTEMECQNLLHLRNVDKLEWEAVASHLERPLESTYAQYARISLLSGKHNVHVKPKWTSKEDAQLQKWRAEDKTLREIATMQTRTLKGLQHRWAYLLSKQAEEQT